MMRQYELVERVLKYDPSANEALLNRAYVYAMKAHGNQKRASGDPYFSHPLEVAAILTELKLDDATIVAALLHDVIEDTDVTRAEIDQMFGKEIGELVDGLTKIKKLDLVTKKAEQAENFRKLLVAISSDIRVLLIKLADRAAQHAHARAHEAGEPPAHLRGDARDLCAAGRPHGHADHARGARGSWPSSGAIPDAYDAVVDKLADIHKQERRARRGDRRRAEGASSPRPASTPRSRAARRSPSRSGARWRTGRSRSSSCPTSTASASSSTTSTTAIARSASCTRRGARCRAASRTTSRRPSRTTTSRSTPPSSARATSGSSCRSAPSGCTRSPSTAWPRTRSTRTASSSASTAANGSAAAQKENPYIWLRRLVETLLEGDNPEEFLEHTKLELFQDQVFCFTPKGRLIALPRGATPIDFAYAVHTDVGNSCVGAVINGRQLPLTTQLQERRRGGDPDRQGPDAAGGVGAHRRHRQGALLHPPRGPRCRAQAIFRARPPPAGIGVSRAIGQEYTDDKLKKGLARLTQKSVEDVHAAVGRGELPVKDVIRAVVPEAELDAGARRPRASAVAASAARARKAGSTSPR